jgi:hypothetical protein
MTEVECEKKPYFKPEWSQMAKFTSSVIGRGDNPEKLKLLAQNDVRGQSPAKCITYDLTDMQSNCSHTTVARNFG